MHKKYGYSWLALVYFLAACSGQTIAKPTETLILVAASVTSAPAPTLITSTVTPTPIWTIVQLITPDAIQVGLWKEYETALGTALLPPNPLRGEVLCEWSILGRSEQQLYVWAFCQSPPYSETLPPSIASVPAVIEFDRNGMVQHLITPGSGSAYASDIRRLFPVDIQDEILSHSIDTSQLEAHINFRREHPEPPLVILLAQPATPQLR